MNLGALYYWGNQGLPQDFNRVIPFRVTIFDIPGRHMIYSSVPWMWANTLMLWYSNTKRLQHSHCLRSTIWVLCIEMAKAWRRTTPKCYSISKRPRPRITPQPLMALVFIICITKARMPPKLWSTLSKPKNGETETPPSTWLCS